MKKEMVIKFDELSVNEKRILSKEGYVQKREFVDSFGRKIHILFVSNGKISFSVLLERGMDVGEIFFKEEKISWEKETKYLLHPDSVNLLEDKGWEKGFYAAVASLGPEIFGTPDEVRTMHGTSSYSKAILSSVQILWNEDEICIEGEVPIKGYLEHPVYKKKIKYITFYNSSAFVRQDTTINLTEERQPIDDGYHIQVAGKFLSKGGRYVIPVSLERVLLRDSAPLEKNPFEIYDFETVLDPIRCYQYIPEEVKCLEQIEELDKYASWIGRGEKITAEMVINSEETETAYVMRPLESFSRSLIAKKAAEEPMYALEPCKTRPNSLRQKAIDGELCYLEPLEEVNSWILLGVTKDVSSIRAMKNDIEKAVI